ncbi:MAG TPA: cyclic nucleotide-binding domain-containing protein [Actinomycetota bacterium]
MATDLIVERLAGLSLFADLSRPQLEAVAHTFEEVWFAEGDRVLRRGLTGTGFYVILEGDAAVSIDGEERARLGRGDYFGEISILLGEAPSADVITLGPLHCLLLGGPDVQGFLTAHPSVMYRMLQTEAHRLRGAMQRQ